MKIMAMHGQREIEVDIDESTMREVYNEVRHGFYLKDIEQRVNEYFDFCAGNEDNRITKEDIDEYIQDLLQDAPLISEIIFGIIHGEYNDCENLDKALHIIREDIEETFNVEVTTLTF